MVKHLIVWKTPVWSFKVLNMYLSGQLWNCWMMFVNTTLSLLSSRNIFGKYLVGLNIRGDHYVTTLKHKHNDQMLLLFSSQQPFVTFACSFQCIDIKPLYNIKQ